MFNKLKTIIIQNKTIIIITFEIFWITVFLVDRMTNSNAVDIPQFIYVNF